MNKFMLKILKLLSIYDYDVKKNYQLERKVKKILGSRLPNPFYYKWDYKVVRDDHEIPVRIFSVSKKKIRPVILFFHGGGWVTGNIDSYNKVCETLARLTDQIVVSVDYQLAPEHRFPAGFLDCYHVAKILFDQPELFDITQDQITLMGDSAGGNLVAAVSLKARDEKEFYPKKQILLYPATYFDHTETSPYGSVVENGTDYFLTSKRVQDYIELYMNKEEDLTNPYFSPLLADDFSNQPKTLIITADLDPLRDEGEAYGQKLKEAGNQVVMKRLQAWHGIISLPITFSSVRECYRIIDDFLERDD